jgi:hypothetical protein
LLNFVTKVEENIWIQAILRLKILRKLKYYF